MEGLSLLAREPKTGGKRAGPGPEEAPLAGLVAVAAVVGWLPRGLVTMPKRRLGWGTAESPSGGWVNSRAEAAAAALLLPPTGGAGPASGRGGGGAADAGAAPIGAVGGLMKRDQATVSTGREPDGTGAGVPGSGKGVSGTTETWAGSTVTVTVTAAAVPGREVEQLSAGSVPLPFSSRCPPLSGLYKQGRQGHPEARGHPQEAPRHSPASFWTQCPSDPLF